MKHGLSILTTLLIGLLPGVVPRLQAQESFFRLESFSENEAGGPEEPAEEMETDRDSFTPATSTVASGRLMLESAWSFVDNRDVQDTHSFPELLVRYGANDWLELRFGSNYEVGGASSSISSAGSGTSEFEESAGGEIERESSVSYGLKAQLTEQDGWLPQSALILQAGTPTSGPETATRLVSTYAFGWKLADGWDWDSSIHWSNASAGGDRFNLWAPSTVLKIHLTESIRTHVEYFGLFSDGQANETVKHYASPGLSFLVTENLEVGVRVGWGLSDDAATFFSNVGFGWQF